MLDAASLVMSRLAVVAAVPLGLKATSTVQVSLGAMAWLSQWSLDLMYWPASAPLSTRVEMFRVSVPLLVIVKVCAALVVPTRWLPKSFASGDADSVGATPVPDGRGDRCSTPRRW